MPAETILSTDFKDLNLFRRGKVRDVYDLGERLLIVSSDRISAFDVVLPCGIPRKGEVLTAISLFWFAFTSGIIQNHLVTADVAQYPPELKKYRRQLQGRSMLVWKTAPLPVECIVRGYLSGSGWKEYQKKQSVSGLKLPPGLTESAKLPEVIFTPSTKAEVGHDVNVDMAYVENKLGRQTAACIRSASIDVYEKASAYARSRGIIIADTKFEFGLFQGKVILIDEVLTPDSSRFWPQDQYQPGKPQPSFDKQYVRDYLETLSWDKTPPAPCLPQDVIANTSRRYLEAYERLTGKRLEAI